MNQLALFDASMPRLGTRGRVLSRLLWLANGKPPEGGRARFYDIKARLLRRHAIRVGTDWQEIVKPCWRCDGTGERGWGDGCYKCDGTGVWDRYWVPLERWHWGGHSFHIPGERTRVKPDVEIRIRGYVKHNPRPDHWPDEAALWLALLYDRRLFRQLVTERGSRRPTWLPMVTLQWVVGTVAWWVSLRRCSWCGRTFPARYPGVLYSECLPCVERHDAEAIEESERDTWYQDGPNADDDAPLRYDHSPDPSEDDDDFPF